MRYYTGIGSRETPKDILVQMTSIAVLLTERSFTLRSGHADGADYAFERGAENAQIWLPSTNFNSKLPVNKNHSYNVISTKDILAFESVNKFHPSPNGLSDYVVKLMARNYRQVIGLNEPNSEFIICWTKDGGFTGGTGQALRIAKHFNIPIYNLFFSDSIENLLKKINNNA